MGEGGKRNKNGERAKGYPRESAADVRGVNRIIKYRKFARLS